MISKIAEDVFQVIKKNYGIFEHGGFSYIPDQDGGENSHYKCLDHTGKLKCPAKLSLERTNGHEVIRILKDHSHHRKAKEDTGKKGKYLLKI